MRVKSTQLECISSIWSIVSLCASVILTKWPHLLWYDGMGDGMELWSYYLALQAT